MRGAPLFEETLQQLWDGLGLQALKLLLAPFGVTFPIDLISRYCKLIAQPNDLCIVIWVSAICIDHSNNIERYGTTKKLYIVDTAFL